METTVTNSCPPGSNAPETKAVSTSKTRTDIPLSQQSMALAHRIHCTCKTVVMAMDLMDAHATTASNSLWEEAWYETIQLCGKHRNWQQAVDIVQDRIPTSDRCRALAISICGRCRQIQPALNLLNTPHNISISTAAPYNAAIAACGTNRAWKDAFRIVHQEMPRPLVTIVTANAMLTTHAKCSQGSEALKFLREGFDQLGVARDRTSYHHTISALLGQGSIEEAVQLVLTDMRAESQINPRATPNKETYDRLIGALVSQRNAAGTAPERRQTCNEMLQQLQVAVQQVSQVECSKKKKRKQTETFTEPPTSKRQKTTPPLSIHNNTDDNNLPRMMGNWGFSKWDLPKTGKRKNAHWQLGTVKAKDNNVMIIGLHPNRNPSVNGIQLWFLRDDPDGKRQKLGYLLMINTPHYQDEGQVISFAGESQFLGLRVTDGDRHKGLAKVFVAVWLQCCLDANLQPCTGKMNKPLLCLVLQHAFQFTPVPVSGGVRARLLPPYSGGDEKSGDVTVVRLTTESSSVKNLAGALPARDVLEQNIQLVTPTDAPEGGRVIEIGGLLQAPTCKKQLQRCIQEVLEDGFQLSTGICKAGDYNVAGEGNEMKDPDDGVAPIDAVKQISAPLTMSRLFLGV
jgi:hypothetical protein